MRFVLSDIIFQVTTEIRPTVVELADPVLSSSTNSFVPNERGETGCNATHILFQLPGFVNMLFVLATGSKKAIGRTLHGMLHTLTLDRV